MVSRLGHHQRAPAKTLTLFAGSASRRICPYHLTRIPVVVAIKKSCNGLEEVDDRQVRVALPNEPDEL